MYKPTGRPIGRPLLFETQTSERIYVPVTPAQRLELQRVAAENGQSVAAVVRDAVNEFVSDYGERQPFPSRRR
jgi:hypothetical protein